MTIRPLTIKLFALLVLTLVAAMATAQDLATVTLDKRNTNFDYTLTVTNTSASDTMRSVTVALTGAAFDTGVLQSGAGNEVPDVGENNDGVTASTLTWNSPGQTLIVAGDIDSNDPSEVTATVNFTSAGPLTVRLSRVADRWSGMISGSSAPLPGPIINGQGTATLSWLPPSEYEDGTALPLTAISGYVLYWGESSRVGNCGTRPTSKLDSCYGNALDLNDGSLQTTPLTLSLSGDATIYFAIIAYTTSQDGSENLSAYSNEARRAFTVEVTDPPDLPDPLPGVPIIQDISISLTCSTNQPGVTCEFTIQ